MGLEEWARVWVCVWIFVKGLRSGLLRELGRVLEMGRIGLWVGFYCLCYM